MGAKCLYRSLCCLQFYYAHPCLMQATSFLDSFLVFFKFCSNLSFLLAEKVTGQVNRWDYVTGWEFPINILFWCLELLMQLFRARCSGPPVPKKLIKEKDLFILCDLMHRWKNLTQNNRSWLLIIHVPVSFSTSTGKHLQFFKSLLLALL